MPVSAGTLVLASEYNTVAELVNKIFGDKYSTVLVTDADRSNHKFGWGAVNVDDALVEGTLITAERLQGLVDRTNIMVDHVNLSDTILVFDVPANRVDVLKRTLIRAEDLNVVENKVDTSILTNNTHLTIDPTNASSYLVDTSAEPYRQTAVWNGLLYGEHRWTFNNYNHARYFFNSGGQLRLNMEMSGGTTAGYLNWADIVNEIGVLSLTWNNVVQSSSRTLGTSEGKGFYDLTDEYQLLFTSSGVTIPDNHSAYGYGYGYGYFSGIYVYDGAFESAYPLGDGPFMSGAYSSGYGYGYGYGGYSTYANRYLKLYGKWANNGRDVDLKITLDDTAFNQPSDGTLDVTPSYLMPDVIERGNEPARFDVNPEPIFSIVTNFTDVFDATYLESDYVDPDYVEDQ